MLPHIAALLLSFSVACSSALDIRDADDEQCVIEYVTVYADGPAVGTGSTASPSTVPMSTTYHIPTHMPVPLKQASASVGTQGSDEGSSSAVSPTGIVSSSGSTTAAAEATSATPSSTQSSAASSSSASSTGAKSNITPGGKKAGISGYGNIAMMADWSQFTPHISWYSDYTPNPPDSGDVKGIGMVWSSPFAPHSPPPALSQPLVSSYQFPVDLKSMTFQKSFPSTLPLFFISHTYHNQTNTPTPPSSGVPAPKAPTTPPASPHSNPSSPPTPPPT